LKHSFKAFTLTELMVVIVIIGILSTIAVPAYRAYTVRARIAEAYYFIDSLKKTAIKQYNENQTGQRIFGTSIADEEAAIGVVVNGGKFVASEHGWVYENGQIPDFNDTPLNFLPVVRGGSGGNEGGLPPTFNNAGDKFLTRDGGDGTACIANDDYVGSTPVDYGIIVTEDPGYNWFGIGMLANFAYPFKDNCVMLVMTGSTGGGEFSITPVIELK
jgi:prepilin-type N-terminal cleavage/methylation domain-containing protein